MLGTADNRDIVMDDPAVLDRLDLSRGNVDDHIAFIEGEIEPAKRLALEASSLKRSLAGTLMAFSVAPDTMPVWRSPMRAWNRFTAAVSPLSQAGPPAAPASPSIARRLRSFVTAGPFVPGPIAAMSVGQPPASTIAE